MHVTFIHCWLINRQVALPPCCYFLNQNSFGSFVKQWICPEFITSLDVSNLYWMSAEFLENVISSMTQLKELNVEGTTLNLSNFSRIFLTCQQISNIAISLDECVAVDMENFELEMDCTTLSLLEQGFAKLLSLKMLLTYNSVSDATSYMHFYVSTLQLLR